MKTTRIIAALLLMAAPLGAAADSKTRNAVADVYRSMGQDLRSAQTLMNQAPVGRSLLSAARSDPRIVGGHLAAAPGQYEFTVSILYNGQHSCGGAIISPNFSQGKVVSWQSEEKKRDLWVITAAHCFTKEDANGNTEVISAEKFTILGGSTTFAPSESWTSFEIEGEPFVPTDFDRVDLAHDVALLKIGKITEMNTTGTTGGFKPHSIQLPPPSSIIHLYQPYARLDVNGWGRLAEGQSAASKDLQTATIPVVERSLCEQHYAQIGWSIPSTHFCAGWAGGGVDSCQGDSGGPVFLDVNRNAAVLDSAPILAGIVSYGKGCARAGLEGIYTSVVAVMPWIIKTIEENT